jgi:hypothetical protein
MLLSLPLRASFQPITLEWKTVVCFYEEWMDARHYLLHGSEIADVGSICMIMHVKMNSFLDDSFYNVSAHEQQHATDKKFKRKSQLRQYHNV